MGTMGEYPHRPGTGEDDPADDWEADLLPVPDEEWQPTPMSAWLRFAAVVVITVGVFNAIEGLVGLFDREFYFVRPDDILLFGLAGWGWVHLAMGCLVTFTGIALFTGAAWARPCTIVVTTINAVAQLVFVAVYPVWSLVVITLCFVVIWAVIVHGDDGGIDR